MRLSTLETSPDKNGIGINLRNIRRQFFTQSRKVAQGSSRKTNEFVVKVSCIIFNFLRGEPWEALRLCVEMF